MNDYQRLKNIYNEIPSLIDARVDSEDPKFTTWYTKAERFLIQHFGEKSKESLQLQQRSFWPVIIGYSTTHEDYISECAKGLRYMQAVFGVLLEEMEVGTDTVTSAVPTCAQNINDLSSVFIVHGHNGELKQSVARLIEKQSIRAVILHEQPNQGATIIEKFEQNSKVGAAICLFTADDVGKAKEGSKEHARARQNVVFEAGFFMGSLGRNHVIIISDPGVELPSDMQGIVYSDSKMWEFEVLKELKALGYEIDLNKAL